MCSVFFCELVGNFQTSLEEIFKQFKLFWFPIKKRHCCLDGFGHFLYSVKVVVEIGKIAVTCKLLKGEQNLVWFNCRSGVITANLWLICGARLFWLPEEIPPSKRDLLLNSCHYMRGLVLVRVSYAAGTTDRDLHFRLMIILGTISGWFLVFYVSVPKYSRNSFGECPCLWVQEKLGQSTQDAGLSLIVTLCGCWWPLVGAWWLELWVAFVFIGVLSSYFIWCVGLKPKW